MLEKIFHLKENNTTVATELIAGLTTFMTMAYILAVNPGILSASGMDKGAIFTATAVGSALATFLMAFLANYPFALAPGMGLNAYFAFTVVLTLGYSWQVALAAIFIEGFIFILLTLTSVREAIFNAIPINLKHAVSVGIGLFIAFIGLTSAKIVVANPATKVGLFSIKASLAAGTFRSEGLGVLLCMAGVLITGFFLIKNTKGGILLGILATWILGILLELTGAYAPNPEVGMYSLIPSFAGLGQIPSLLPTLGKMDFTGIARPLDFAMVVFAFLFVDLFDTLGTLVGVASKADMLDSENKLPRIKGALLADALGTCAGAVLGTSTVTTYVESASGVSAGGRTGLTAVTTGLLFLASLFLAPVFLAVPGFATAPALIVVGFLMVTSITKIDFEDFSETIPCYICIITMPFAYSISEGISFGIISYVILNVLSGKAKEKKISKLMYVLALIFIVKYFFV
ncbi:MAG: NCS2 family permease [Fusobacteriaceae bacterium]|jgi:AGZA family xanthine/uracil permease-like MFS transporter|nr:NCS2 family permease [Fusobacteriaceae bacterium]